MFANYMALSVFPRLTKSEWIQWNAKKEELTDPSRPVSPGAPGSPSNPSSPAKIRNSISSANCKNNANNPTIFASIPRLSRRPLATTTKCRFGWFRLHGWWRFYRGRWGRFADRPSNWRCSIGGLDAAWNGGGENGLLTFVPDQPNWRKAIRTLRT